MAPVGGDHVLVGIDDPSGSERVAEHGNGVSGPEVPGEDQGDVPAPVRGQTLLEQAQHRRADRVGDGSYAPSCRSGREAKSESNGGSAGAVAATVNDQLRLVCASSPRRVLAVVAGRGPAMTMTRARSGLVVC